MSGAPVVGGLRVLGWARLTFGAFSLLALGQRHLGRGGRLPPAVVTAARALAVRDIAQGSLLARRPDGAMARTGTVIDVLHLSSMLPVVAVGRRYRRAAAVSAVTAAVWVAWSEAAVRRGALAYASRCRGRSNIG